MRPAEEGRGRGGGGAEEPPPPYFGGMSDEARPFYARLSTEYSELIRALVPRYDELMEQVVELTAAEGPTSLLDVGAGVGELTGTILARVPGMRAVCLEPSPEMAAEARRALEPFGTRVRVVEESVQAYRPEERPDAAVSTLVLHNLSPPERGEALRRLRAWLRPGALFVWGDFVRMSDPVLEARVVAWRERFAVRAGCPPDVVEWNFRKEAEADHPLSVEGALEAALAAGFETADLVWAHDAFAVVAARAPRDVA